MESWSYVSGEKGFSSDEFASAGTIPRLKNGFAGWESKTPFSSYGSNTAISTSENHGFAELGFPIKDVFTMFNPITAISGEDESSSKLSSSAVESTSFVDLNLGRFGDYREARNLETIKESPSFCSSNSSKRMRNGGLIPCCQVLGCGKDLSSCKDYHKRHKVCEVHSKTAKVIVNGIEQRFCQQCSRFHLLAEFDDGKRSCRKRLAGHNERRRKPNVAIHKSTNGKLLHSFNGSRYQGTPHTSFLCQNILPTGLPLPQKYSMNDWNRHIKLEDGAEYSPQSSIQMSNSNLFPKPIFQQSNSLSHHLVQNPSFRTEDLTVLDSTLSDSGHALSLLSSQSQNYPNRSSGIPVSHSHAQFSTNPVSKDLFGTTGKFQFDPILISDGIFHGSEQMDSKDKDGLTIDLLQLSSQLQRVEHQRQSMQETDAFVGLRTL